MSPEQARRVFGTARVAVLATTDAGGQPHLVPMVFALAGHTLYSAVDAKPKRSTALRRLANVAVNPRVAVLAQHYDDADWSRLWWVRADGTGRVLDPESPEVEQAVSLLAGRYPQYREQRPAGPVLAVTVRRWTGWSALPQR